MNNINRDKNNIFITTAISCLFFSSIIVCSMLLYYKYGKDAAISIIIIGISIFIAIFFMEKDIFHPIVVYTLTWLGLSGVACIKISSDQKEWGSYMWLVVITAYITFVLGYFIANLYIKKSKKIKRYTISIDKEKLYKSIIILMFLSIVTLLIEIIILRYIPLFSSNMSAYRDFHISGIHYFVVTSGIIPAMTIFYKSIGGERKISIINIVAIAIPILIVSRQLSLLQGILGIISYHYFIKRINVKKVLILIILVIVIFSQSFKWRNQDISYFKDAANITVETDNAMIQPFIYFAINFENLRNVVENFNDYKYGVNIAYPVLALTMTKGLVDYSHKTEYLNNKNLNTSTYLADFYFDFGYVGVIVLPLILGFLYCKRYKLLINDRKNFNNIIYMLLVYCLIFCFFVNWYTNPSMIFYLIILLIIKKYIQKKNII